MLQSMTGFAVKESDLTIHDVKKVHITITLKALNGRYFEANCKLPFMLSHLETDIIKHLKNHLIRGSIYLTIYTSSGSSIPTTIQPAHDIIGQYIKAVHEAQTTWNIPGTFTITELIRLPHIFETKEPLIGQHTRDALFVLLEELITELKKSRSADGAGLQEDLYKRLEVMTHLMELIEPQAHNVMENKKIEILKTLSQAQAAIGSTESPPPSIATYAALDKIDIHEEITRFKSLLKQLHAIIESPEDELGKKIDFTLQELFREINTLSAKCSDTMISKQAISIKVELEKARELTQNIL